MKIYITGEIPEIAVTRLRQKGFKVNVFKGENPITGRELIKNAKDADGIISLLSDKIDSSIIDNLPKCKVIANYAVGYNNIDIKHAAEKNITVTNTPDVLTDATADLAFALTLACARRIIEAEKFLRDKKFKGWKPKLMMGLELKGKTFGILGAGRIGTATAIRANAFGMKIIYYSNSINEMLEKSTGARKTTLNNLLEKSDVVSLHLPLKKETFHLLNKDKLKLLKKTAILINTARGEIVDEKEMIKLLKAKKIKSAGLDVYENEPNINPELLKLNNVVLLPHIGSATEDARNNMALLAANNIIKVLSGKKALTPVNK